MKYIFLFCYMIHRVQNSSLDCASLNNAPLQSKIMISSATLMYLEKLSLGPVSKTPICISHADREKTVSQIRANSQELRRPIFKVFSFIRKEQKWQRFLLLTTASH